MLADVVVADSQVHAQTQVGEHNRLVIELAEDNLTRTGVLQQIEPSGEDRLINRRILITEPVERKRMSVSFPVFIPHLLVLILLSCAAQNPS